MQFVVKRDILLKSLNFVQGVVEKNLMILIKYLFLQQIAFGYCSSNKLLI